AVFIYMRCTLFVHLLQVALTLILVVLFFSSRRRHTRSKRDWSSDVCSSDLVLAQGRIILPVTVNEKINSSFSATTKPFTCTLSIFLISLLFDKAKLDMSTISSK